MLRSSSATSTCGVGAGEAGDDELHAHQRAFREVGIERDDAAVVGLRQQRADALAHLGSVAIARHVDEQRDEPVEAVDAGKHAHARPRLQVEDALAPFLQLLHADLEQLVARKGVEDVEQRLAVVAARRIAGGGEHHVDLVAQEGDLARRAHIGLRGEQADEADLALRAAVGAVGLDADVVHVHAPVHAAQHVGLGDDERGGREEEAAHLRRHGHQLGAAPQHLHARVAQHAEPAALDRDEVDRFGIGSHVAGELELPHAEEGEVVLPEPLQKGHRLGQQVAGDVLGRHLELPHGRMQPLDHRLPVGDDDTHLVEDGGEGGDRARAASVSDRA